jgi:hypothetical protein
MDSQNDISKRHDNAQNDISKNTNIILGLFPNSLEKSLFVSLKKIDKIVAALYLVTDVMNPDVPLTHTIRTQSLELLSAAAALVGGAQPLSRDRIARLLVQVDHVASLVRIGSIAHHISPMNADIIETELGKVVGVLSDAAQQFAATESSFIASPVKVAQPVVSSDILKEKSFDETLQRLASKRHQNDIKTTLIGKNDTVNDITQIKTTFQNDITTKANKIDRKQEILQAIKGSQPSTLNDLRRLIKDCSEKTLQRELAALIAMGLVRKEGNKRWTTYKVV